MCEAVIEDWEKFNEVLAAQPLCRWTAQKQRELDAGMHNERSTHAPPKQSSNADLAAALSAMA